MSLKSWFEGAFPPHGQEAYLRGQSAIPVDLSPPAKPRLAAVRTAPSRDEFAAWRADPTTVFVMAALARNAEECREHWLELSWATGEADQQLLDAMRERSDALLGFTASYEAFCQTLGLEPETEPQNG